MKKNSIAIMAIIAVVLLLAFFVYALDPPRPVFADAIKNKTVARASDFFYDYEINRYPSKAEVGVLNPAETIIGLDVDPDKLNFGAVPVSGSYSKRTVNLTSRGKDTRIFIDVHGGIKPFVRVDNTGFVLKRDQKVTLGVGFYTKNNNAYAQIGNYSGEIDIVIQIPKFDFIYGLWGSK